MRVKRIILTFLVVLCMVTIFLFSNQEAEKSQNLSDGVAVKIIEAVAKMTKQEITKNKKEQLVENTRTLIRKSAHFTIYLLLGILMFWTLKSYNLKHPVIYAFLFCFLYACTDEIHQLFVSERAGRVLDVFIDSSGAFLGILCSQGIYNFVKRKTKI